MRLSAKGGLSLWGGWGLVRLCLMLLGFCALSFAEESYHWAVESAPKQQTKIHVIRI